ncbi:MAG TPA: SDR family NAD(P)-dependent oxidoreductase, partial [Chloroflexia bacterium]|nr:SDR family NAD(P)-dependent oxidoreductase [Chloroflexia bacterium]
MQLEGRVALVTGAGSGIGKAAALLLAKEGAKVGALGIDEDNLQGVVKRIKKDGGDAVALVADVSQPSQMEKA